MYQSFCHHRASPRSCRFQLKSKLIGALDSVSEGVADIDQASGMIGLVGDLTKDSTSVSDKSRVTLPVDTWCSVYTNYYNLIIACKASLPIFC